MAVGGSSMTAAGIPRRATGELRPPVPADWSQVVKLYELSTDLLAVFDRGGCFVLLNPAWERILGYRCEELLGRRAVELLHPEDLGSTLALSDQGEGTLPEVVECENRYRG